MRHVVAILLALLIARPAAAQQLPPAVAALPAPARALWTGAVQMCREVGGRLTLDGSDVPYVRKADFNGDGQPDYLLSDSALNCSTAASIFCGSAGCNHTIFLSGPGGYRSACDGYAQDLTVDTAATPPRLKIAAHGSDCGRAGADTCYSTLAWNGRQFAPVGAATPPRATAPAAASTWTATRAPNGLPLVQTTGVGPLARIGLTCDSGRPFMVVRLEPAPAPRLLPLTVAVGAQRVDLRLIPVGKDQAWAAPLAGTPLLDLLAANVGEARITLAGRALGSIPLAGAADAMRTGLSSCHTVRPAAVTAPRPSPR